MAITLKQARPVTDDEILEWSRRNPGYKFELTARGEIVVTPTGIESGGRSGEVFGQLRDWAKRDGAGRAFDSSTGFRLPDGSLKSPDASWVRRDRLDALTAEQRKRFGPLCPDAVFEVQSESNATAELRSKARQYLASGARLAVLIDPETRTIEVHRPGQDPDVYRDPGTVALDPELPGFVLDLAPVFGAGLLG